MKTRQNFRFCNAGMQGGFRSFFLTGIVWHIFEIDEVDVRQIIAIKLKLCYEQKLEV